MVGTLSATMTAVAPQASAPAFTGSGTLDAAMTPVYAVASAFSSSGTLSATNVRRAAVTATLAGSGILAATWTQKYAPAPAFAGTGTLSATAIPAIAVIGTPTASGSTTCNIPTHAVGDLIIIFAGRDGSSIPTKPTASGTVPAWTTIDSNATTPGVITAYFVATATNHTSGTWSGADSMAAIVLRNQHASSFIGGHAVGTGTGTNTSTAPAVTMTNSTGTSFLLHMYMLGASTGPMTWGSAPSGYTRQIALNASIGGLPAICVNSKNVTTSDGAIAQTGTWPSADYRGATIEVLN